MWAQASATRLVRSVFLVILATQEESTMSEVAYIGRNLKAARVRRLLTQEELAEMARVSHSTIVNIERDQTVSHFRTIRKLAKVLDVDPTSLLGE
jgi:DNA-binding XRE family transcriptional regulator